MQPAGANLTLRCSVATSCTREAVNKANEPSGSGSVEISRVDPRSPEASFCLNAYFQELDHIFEGGFDVKLTVSADPDELVPPKGLMLVARIDGHPVGCGAVKSIDGSYGEIKRMWVSPTARGQGVAQRLLRTLERETFSHGIRTCRLDTHRSLTDAQALYIKHGYTEIPPYNSNPYAHRWYEKQLSEDHMSR